MIAILFFMSQRAWHRVKKAKNSAFTSSLSVAGYKEGSQTDCLLCLDAQTGCCSEGCENCCCDARYELHDPLEGFLLRHDKPPFITFIIYPLSFIISKGLDQFPVSNPPLPTLLPFLVNTLVAASLLSPFLMAIALTVVVSVRVIASLYRVLSALGAVPSVV